MKSSISISKKLNSIFGRQPVFVVGGAVRDRLMKRPTSDIDLVVKKDTQNWGKTLAKTLGGTSFPLDLENGIIRVALKPPFRVDLAACQGKDIYEDLQRRDFSINAMAVPLSQWVKPKWKSHIIDLYGGQNDLQKKKIRHFSNTVFSSDPLRLLRALRIGADLQFSIDQKTAASIKKGSREIKKSAPERIREEILKLFSSFNSFPYLTLMEKLGILAAIFPESLTLKKTAPRYYGKGGVLKHVLESVQQFEEIVHNLKTWFPDHHQKISSYLNELSGGHPRFSHLKWALLLHDVGKPATAKVIKGRLRFFNHEYVGGDMVKKFSTRYRWSNDETQTYVRLVQNHMRPGNLASHKKITDKALHRFFRDLGSDAIAMLLVSLGDHLTYLTPRERKKRKTPHEKLTRKMVNLYFQDRNRILPSRVITGHDIMKEFQLKPGKLIGQILKEVTECQSEGKIKTKQDALGFVGRYLKTFL